MYIQNRRPLLEPAQFLVMLVDFCNNLLALHEVLERQISRDGGVLLEFARDVAHVEPHGAALQQARRAAEAGEVYAHEGRPVGQAHEAGHRVVPGGSHGGKC